MNILRYSLVATTYLIFTAFVGCSRAASSRRSWNEQTQRNRWPTFRNARGFRLTIVIGQIRVERIRRLLLRLWSYRWLQSGRLSLR